MRIHEKGFTLIETMVALTILSIAVVAPMSLASQSLSSAYYARDQITAANLAQEGLESVRAVRDANILLNAYGTPTPILNNIPINTPFTIDARTNAIAACGGSCQALQTDGTFYGYQSGWASTNFTRSILANYVTGTTDEIKVSVTVSWSTGSYQARQFVISENLYNWVSQGSASQ